jgi:acetyltransferase-like isoleucine patch superfamily enzyme
MLPLYRFLQALFSVPRLVREALDDRVKRLACAAAPSARLSPRAQIYNQRGHREAIEIGPNTMIDGQLLVFPEGGQIRIGEYCYVGEGARIWSAANVVIGDRIFISHGVNIHDNNAHSLSAAERHRHFRESLAAGGASFAENTRPEPVVIEDDAWIGFNATILKGVTIGRGAVIGAGSLVAEDVSPFTIVAGQPARVIGTSQP